MSRYRAIANAYCSARACCADRGGALAVKFAILAPALLAITALGVDCAYINHQRTRLQAAADAGSVAAAKEMGLVDVKTENLSAVVESVARNHLSVNAADAYAAGRISIDTDVRSDPYEVEVTATQRVDTLFGDLGLDIGTLTVSSVARIVGKPNICVLGLDPDEAGTISLEVNARVTGNDCAVFSNSDHTNGVRSKQSSTLSASLICSRGGIDGSKGNFMPDPISDCPGFDDPLADRPEPEVGSCADTDLTISAQTLTLSPGTYCGGIKIVNTSEVLLQPGIYIIKDGTLEVSGGSSLSGSEVGFFFTGDKSVFDFKADSTISLAAPVDGPMAGLLMFESRTKAKGGSHRIESNDARTLLGTIYLPASELRVDASSTVADQSAYTAIVARTMRLYGGPHLVLNCNFNATGVPVPEGIRGSAQPIALVK